MASEALPTDQTTDGILEEKEEIDNIKDTNAENVSEPKEIESKDEETKLKAESSTYDETALTGSEEKPEGKSDSTDEVRKAEKDNDKASGSDDLLVHVVEEVDNFKKEAEISAPSEQAAEVTGEELKNQADVSNTPVRPPEVVEKPTEDFEESSIQESNSEASKERAVSESVTEKVEGAGEVTEPSTIPSSISEAENNQKEPPILSTAKEPASNGVEGLGTQEGAKASQGESKKVEEAVSFENLGAVVTDVAELQEAGKGAVALEATVAPGKTDANSNADEAIEDSAKEEMRSREVEKVVKGVAVDAGKPDPSAAIEVLEAADASSVTKITEEPMKPETKVEEQQEKIIEDKEPYLSDKKKIDAASDADTYEGEKVTESIEKLEEKKNESLEGDEAALIEISEYLNAATEVPEVSSGERKVSEGAERKEEITKQPDAASMIAEASSQVEKDSEGSAMFEETKNEGLKDEKISLGETSKDFDAASEVAGFSSQEKNVTGSPEIVTEKKEESLESDKTTSVETSKSFDAAACTAVVSSKDEKSSIATEMVEEKKDNSQEGEKPTSVETSKDFNVAAGISRVSSGEEKTSGGTEMVQEKKDEGERAPESTETISEKKGEVLESARKTLGETFKEHDMEEKNIFAASAAERVADSEEVEKGKELAKDTAGTRKPDDGNISDPSKNDVPKQDKESPKQEAPKASQRHSNNIISKVKHSIVKAKRAILGKSPSSKTMSAGTKDEIKVN
ncbi:uncharacterized protein [Elaeis guineensis]|uniref:Golgin subfamily A member 6-like protein 22 n=1 Tax=Elaeis guineensis var. tenera TaxID=51953 RepID=A0A6I9SDW2_ELAGV|nr:golgin subfamily A member 6-like protein 22 [Elaeis guineensis]